MSEKEFPGFEGDDANKAQPAPPQKPKTAATAKPAAALGAAKTPGIKEEGAKPPPLGGATGPVAFEFEASESPSPTRHAAPVQAAPSPASDPPTARTTLPSKGARGAPAPSAPLDESVDPDVAPGSRKDLWTCPHCGAGNRPGRPTCRTCGKSPDEPVVRAWTKNPLVVGGIAVVALVALVVLVRAMTTTDLTLHQPDAAHIDKAMRIGGKGESHKVPAGDFTARSKVAVCGVVLGTINDPRIPGSLKAVLVLGPGAVDAASAGAVTFSDDDVTVVGTSNKTVTLRLMTDSDPPKIAKGQIVSLTGDLGQVEGNNPSSMDFVIYVTGIRTGQ